MKICFLADSYLPYLGGSQTFLRDLVFEMKKKHEIVMIADSQNRGKRFEELDNLKIYRIFSFPMPRIQNYLVMSIVTYLKAREIDISDCDIINVQNLSPCFAGSLLGKQFHIPYVQTIEAIPSKFMESIANFLHRKYLHASNYDKLVVWTEELKNIMKIWGLESTVIGGGINTDEFSPKIKPEKDAKEKYKKPLIVTAKPLYENNARGIAYLAKAMKKVDGTLLIVGNGEYRRWLENKVRKDKLSDKVIFAGNIEREKIPKYYAAADIIAFSILFDVGVRPSVSLMEAMSMEKPVLLTKNFEHEDINNNNLCLAKITDPDDISDKINILIEDKNKSLKIARNGRKLIEKKYSIKTISRHLLDLYETLI